MVEQRTNPVPRSSIIVVITLGYMQHWCAHDQLMTSKQHINNFRINRLCNVKLTAAPKGQVASRPLMRADLEKAIDWTGWNTQTTKIKGGPRCAAVFTVKRRQHQWSSSQPKGDYSVRAISRCARQITNERQKTGNKTTKKLRDGWRTAYLHEGILATTYLLVSERLARAANGGPKEKEPDYLAARNKREKMEKSV